MTGSHADAEQWRALPARDRTIPFLLARQEHLAERTLVRFSDA